jgi:NADH-quinone oxidoreductase subunit E
VTSARPERPGVQAPDAPPESLGSEEFQRQADAIVARYPNARSATLPLVFLVQSVEGYVTEDGMRKVADILGLTPAQVLASVSFYTMLKRRPQGEYLVSVCRNITCTHVGAREVIASCRERLRIEPGDGAPSLQVNYEDFYTVTPEGAVALIDKLEAGEEVTSVRGEPIRTHREISHEMATSGLRVPGSAGERTARTIGGESPRADTGPGFRPKAPGEQAGNSGG